LYACRKPFLGPVTDFFNTLVSQMQDALGNIVVLLFGPFINAMGVALGTALGDAFGSAF
jgi:hypothetical protein